MRTGRVIPSLDGLRALSIAFVIAGHLTGTQYFPAAFGPVRAFAGPGVRVFFVISGFLITTLLLDELERNGRISLAGFYKRRACRIFPAFYVFLAVMAIAGAVSGGALARAATYTINYVTEREWNVAHIWSLAVEEQFYLLWPAALVVLGRRKGLMAAAAVVALSPVIRTAQFALFPGLREGIGSQFHTVADALACGCLLAGLRERLWGNALYRGFLSSPWFGVVPVLLVAELAVQPGRPLYLSLAGMTLLNVGITLCVDRAVRLPDTASGRLLNAAPLRFIGVLSYSLYLWQQVFLNRDSGAWWSAFPANVMLAMGAALISYYGIERPMMALGRRPWRLTVGPLAPRHREPAV